MTATKTTLIDWTTLTNGFIDQDDLNGQVRDNLEWMKTRVSNSVFVSTTSTTSTSFAQMTGSDCAMTCVGGNVLLLFVGIASNNTAGVLSTWDLAIDGARVGDATNGLTAINCPDVNRTDCIAMVWATQTPPTAGSRTFSVWWKTASNTQSGLGYLFCWEWR